MDNQHTFYWNHKLKLKKFLPSARSPFQSELWALNKLKGNHLSILDIGCGSGHFLSFAPRIIKILEYTGLDVSSEQIKQARKYWETKNLDFPYNFKVLDSEKLEHWNYDCLWSTGLIQHVNNPIEQIRNIIRNSIDYTIFDLKISFEINQYFSTKVKLDSNSVPYNIISINELIEIFESFTNKRFCLFLYKVKTYVEQPIPFSTYSCQIIGRNRVSNDDNLVELMIK